MRIATYAILLTICISTKLWAATYDFVSGDRESYRASFNANGAVLESRRTKIYFGRSCDAYSPQFGSGSWGQANGGFLAQFGSRSIGFPRQQLFHVNDRVSCELPDAAPVSTSNSQTLLKFDQFFENITQCEKSRDFSDFYDSIVARYRNDADAVTAADRQEIPLKIPPNLMSGFGDTVSRIVEDRTEVDITIRGTLRGVPISRLQIWIGRENGVREFGIFFFSDRSQVERTFGRLVRAGNEILRRRSDEDGPGTIAFSRDGTAIWCDLSN